MNTTVPTWWLLSVIPDQYLGLLEQSIASDTASKIGSSAHQEVLRLLKQAQEKLTELQKRSSDSWVWDAELLYENWSPDEKRDLNKQIEFLPPLKYLVSLKTSQYSDEDSDLEECSLLLTPAEFKVITLLNSDIGRRIGDELDGRRPS